MLDIDKVVGFSGICCPSALSCFDHHRSRRPAASGLTSAAVQVLKTASPMVISPMSLQIVFTRLAPVVTVRTRSCHGPSVFSYVPAFLCLRSAESFRPKLRKLLDPRATDTAPLFLFTH
jgi:hypothetical protein